MDMCRPFSVIILTPSASASTACIDRRAQQIYGCLCLVMVFKDWFVFMRVFRCMYACAPCDHLKSEEGFKSARTDLELPCGPWEPGLGCLAEASSTLNAEQCLQPWCLDFMTYKDLEIKNTKLCIFMY